MAPLRVLFVCSRNQWRSPTAERLWREDQRVLVRSAGTSASAKRSVRAADIAWADLVLVMEDTHARQLRRTFRQLNPTVIVLDIPDEYGFMDPQLVTLLQATVEPILEEAMHN